MSVDAFNQVPPYGRIHHWLGEKTVGDLLFYAQSNHHLFEESAIGHGSHRVDHTRRVSSTLRKLGHFESHLQAKVQDLLPAMVEKIGGTVFTPSRFELELVAHGDGAFFSRHIDTATQYAGPASHRIISAVYYFYRVPKAFTGGVLRIHSLAASGQQGTFVDVEPEFDMLVFFPSWFPHEVLPVACPGGHFMESRFAINCWIHN